MAYDDVLTARMRDALRGYPAISEKKMMGGVCFLSRGNMVSGADKGRFMFRVGKPNEEEALSRPGATAMVQGGRKMTGLIFVDAGEVDDGSLSLWVALAMSFVDTLPAK